MHIELGYGAKWKLVYQFTQSGPFAEHYIHRYTQVSVLYFLGYFARRSKGMAHICS